MKPEEFVAAMVMCDLLEKGLPETRIAKYLVEKGWTGKRVNKLCAKLQLSEEWERKIWIAFVIAKKGAMPLGDGAQQYGKTLRNSLL